MWSCRRDAPSCAARRASHALSLPPRRPTAPTPRHAPLQGLQRRPPPSTHTPTLTPYHRHKMSTADNKPITQQAKDAMQAAGQSVGGVGRGE